MKTKPVSNTVQLPSFDRAGRLTEVDELLSRRVFLQSTTILSLAGALSGVCSVEAIARELSRPSLSPQPSVPAAAESMLREVDYNQVHFLPSRHQAQFESTIATLLEISDDTMLKPFRVRAGQAAPGVSMGGWYDENPQYTGGNTVGFAPGHCFGQWLSALARAFSITGSQQILAKVKRLMYGYAKTICEEFYADFRFPAYTYDKLVCGLLDCYELAGLKDAMSILQKTTDAALPNLPPRALARGEAIPAHPERGDWFRWDETYTLPENLFRAYELGAGDRYRALAIRFLMDKGFFDPLSQGQNALAGKHAYSFMNALSSAMRAYIVLGSEKHLTAGRNAFDMVQAQSYVTGGWGPDETFVQPGAGTLGRSLETTHQSFETCGGYAHMKLTRYLLRATREARYGDSMESVIYNTVLGVLPLKPDGSAFYYSDYNVDGHKDYYRMKCPCCAGTLPQIVADYRLCTYLQDDEGPIVNLYIPSTLTWNRHGAKIKLTQTTEYPLDGRVTLRLDSSRPRMFAIRLRIPAWANEGTTVQVNGGDVIASWQPGSFMSIRRTWQTGDCIVMDIPMGTRLQTVDDEHQNTVALSYGPLSLFALHTAGGDLPKVTRHELLGATRRPGRNDEWIVETQSGKLSLVPFTSIGDERYSTYLKVEKS